MKYLMELYKSSEDILHNKSFLKEKNFKHHYYRNAYQHSVNVAYLCLRLCKSKKVDRVKLARTALLHDYYLYDWHDGEKWHRPHGFKHPKIACKNAMRDFTNIDPEAIKRHMWPLTIKPPKSRIGWIITWADKIATFCEFFNIKICY